MKIGDIVEVLLDIGALKKGKTYKIANIYSEKRIEVLFGENQYGHLFQGEYKLINHDYEEAPETSARHNSGKTQTRELDPSFILGMGDVLTKSRAKYEHFNWCKPTKLSTPYESAMRHLMAFQSGENIDPETGLSHLLHVATNIMFMYYHITNNPEFSDDRFFKKEKK